MKWISRSAVTSRLETRSVIQCGNPESTSIPSRHASSASAVRSMWATSSTSNGAAKHAKTCARRAAMRSACGVTGASTMTRVRGRTSRISAVNAMSSTTDVPGSVTTTS